MPKSNAQLQERDLTKEEERVMIKGTAGNYQRITAGQCLMILNFYIWCYSVVLKYTQLSFSCNRLNGQLQEGQVSGCFKSEISNHVFIVQGKIPH